MNYKETMEKFGRLAARKLALTTERSYRGWINSYLKFLRTPEAAKGATSEEKMERFLSDMARNDYSAVTQNQAFNAVLFLYRHVFGVQLKDVNALRCRRMARERYTPTQAEMMAILHHLKDTDQYRIRLAGGLMYACGLRVSEVCELRGKDFDLERMVVTVFEGKGGKDRVVRLPEILLPAIRRQLARARHLAELDIAERQPVQLPGRMDIKAPRLQFDAEWHFVFPSAVPCAHPRTGKRVRWCMSPDVLQRAVAKAKKAAGISARITPHCFRHAYCSHLLDRGENIKRVSEAMGHTDIRTTAGYGRKDCEGMRSPLDAGAVIPFPGRAEIGMVAG